MKLQKIDIYGFGNIVDQSYQFGPGMNIFRGDNGSGKTTIMTFILSIMFGFPNLRKKNVRQYDVNDNVIYGGRIYLTDTRFGRVILKRTRQANKQQLSMIIEDGEEINVDNFDNLWEGLSREDYLAFFGFNEQELMNFVWDDEDDFAKSLVSLGVSGRQVLTEINPLLASEADEIFLPNGKKPYLNQHFNQLENNHQKLTNALKNEQEYFNLTQALEQNKAELSDLLDQQEAEKERKLQLQLADKQSGSVDEHRQLAKQLADYQFYNFPDDIALQWRESDNRLQQLNQEYDQLSLSTDGEIAGKLERMTDAMWWIEDHSNVADQMLSEARAYRDKVRQHSDLNQEVIEKRYEQNRLLAALGVESVEALPRDLTDEERENWQHRYNKIDGQRIFYQNGKQDLASMENTAKDLKKERAELAAELAEVEKNNDRPPKATLRNIGIGILILGVILFAAFFVIDTMTLLASGLMVAGIGLLLIVIGMTQVNRKRQEHEDRISDYKLDIKDIDNELISLELKEEQQQLQLETLRSDTKAFMDELDEFIIGRGGSKNVEGIVWIQNNYINDIKQLEREIAYHLNTIGLSHYQRTHEEEWKQYEANLSNRDVSMDSVFQQFEDDYHNVRQIIADSGYSKQQQRDNARKADSVKQKIMRLNNERKNLLKEYQMSDGTELLAAIRHEEEMRELRHRFDILSRQVDPSLARYQDNSLSISDQQQSTQTKLDQISHGIQDLNEENAGIRTKMHNIEASGLASNLQQKDANYFAETYDLAVEWAARKLAVSIFESATLGQEGDVVDRVLDQANIYLSDISNHKLEKMRFNNESVEVYYQLDNKTLWLPVNQLSRGEKAMLFIAMRFAFLNAQLGQVDLPIIIDEAFLHLDLQARDNIYRFLDDQSRDKQIILFTIDHEAVDILPNSHIYNI